MSSDLSRKNKVSNSDKNLKDVDKNEVDDQKNQR